MAVNSACHKDLPYDPLTDFVPVTNFANLPNVIVVNLKFPTQDFKGFVQALKAEPTKYSYGIGPRWL